MESSRFIQLTPQILVEYIYTDQASPTTYNTSAFPIEIMRDTYTSGSYLFNSDSVSATMGNYRDISVAAINKNRTKYAYLDTDVGVPYNDFDTNLTNTSLLPQTFSPNLDIVYDRIKIHFVAGFSFENFDGIIFEVTVPRRDGVEINLSSINFLKSDTPVFNADPFLLADKLYSSYIEWKVPSLFFMNNQFSSSVSNGLGYRLTEGQGFIGTPPINIKAVGISKTTVENGYNLYDVENINSASILNRDIYDLLFAQVIESTGGDYFELSGEVEGSTLANFIAQLNSSGGDYMVFHEITISEQIGTSFIQTSSQMFTQTTSFDEPILLRPIILNSSVAVSFAINYVLRLYNRVDNTQIIKNARLVTFETKKYGRRLMKINLGTVPTVANIYNKITNDNGQNISINSEGVAGQTSDQIDDKLVVRTQYVTSFRDRLNIKAAISPAKIQNINDVN
mgnify:CR=1 FL=1|tara:strand:- start:62398 stop:63753 length:1356 start_codon:yes stop_codon:yes gene_type:complete